MENHVYEEVIKGVEWNAKYNLQTTYLDGLHAKDLKFSDILEVITCLKSENIRLSEEKLKLETSNE